MYTTTHSCIDSHTCVCTHPHPLTPTTPTHTPTPTHPPTHTPNTPTHTPTHTHTHTLDARPECWSRCLCHLTQLLHNFVWQWLVSGDSREALTPPLAPGMDGEEELVAECTTSMEESVICGWVCAYIRTSEAVTTAGGGPAAPPLGSEVGR